MLKVINNPDGSVTIKEVSNVSRETLADFMERYEGTHEYNGIVAECQKWYYGSLVKASWCATWVSYSLAQMGLLASTMGSKHENVYNMYLELSKRSMGVSVAEIKRGDIIILKFEQDFSWNTKKHVTVAAEDYNESGLLTCIGGNQDDSICTKVYSAGDIVAAFRPAYA